MGVDMCKMVMGRYVFTAEDLISSFKGKGRIGPFKKLQRHPIPHEPFRYLSNLLTLYVELC